ncbi:type I restriction endonuclease subunit R [Coraliomargarita algicola]|uniref:Type I restriction enzyme endonuclease subunit n=1 Tax=Coraliomargarita algicola TaxID=3092156 RepID=A0ABZ0RQN2_9BACT|nr:type I restriction endonuclease subunit R [Coraliomargarita sp. J2-16]WPJ95239.1 type I restriction endonuclease subunit R [Coraliomargarita sp. J2-16]
MTASKANYPSPESHDVVINEAHIEDRFIAKLVGLKYTNRPDITKLESLEANFREKFERLNAVKLSDSEFARLLDQITTPDVYKSAELLRSINSFERDDGTPLNFTLVNIKDWCKNDYEIVSQLRINTRYSFQRYDVILLINGIPCTQIELKTLEISPRRAMQQIVDYKSDPGNGYSNTLLSFMQLFIVSNRTNTYYFANNNLRHFAFDAKELFLPVYQYADRLNKKIPHLDRFAEAFLPKCTLGHMISRYMVLVASEQKLLMMRPYQIYAVKDIVDCIHQNSGNGYIWHTTGSGKTLTSFKASTLLKNNPDIDKCLFVVDRKDLDRQTREEFNKFQENCVEENTNTHTLVRRLLSDDYADKVIVTTIQKLGLALDESSKRNIGRKERKQQTYKELLAPVADKRLAIIFDECHRSQFGDNHKAIKDFFPKSQLFGFTGTPIFEKNATVKQIDGEEASYKTTADIFQQELHKYTITHAIEDKNVLKFHIDYFKPEVVEGKPAPKPGEALAKRAVIEAILERHDQTTAARKFNAVLATASINDAIAYHQLFADVQLEKQAADPDFRPLHIACVFSPPAEGNPDVKQLQEDLPQEKADNEVAPNEKKLALEAILTAYNEQYGTNHRLSEFDTYYQDVQDRIKAQRFPLADLRQANPKAKAHKIDITIVVDMLLTGFDSKYLNTLYVDKNLKYHGLIQAFSRTNRILNDSKPHGHIFDFRQQQDAVDEAIKLFSGEHEDRSKEIWLVDPAPAVIEKLDAAVQQLNDFMHSQGLTDAPEDVLQLKGDAARAQFIKTFKEVQRLKTQLDQYTDLEPEQKAAIEATLPADTHRAFKGAYIDTARKLKQERETGDGSSSDEVQELDFEFVLFASATIDYDYIMELVTMSDQKTPGKQKMTREQLVALIASDAQFADQRELLEKYIRQLDLGQGRTKEAILEGYETFKTAEAAQQLEDIATAHGLAPDALTDFVETILHRHVFDGEHLTDLMAPLELGWKARSQAERALMKALVPLLNQRAEGQEISGLSGYEN